MMDNQISIRWFGLVLEDVEVYCECCLFNIEQRVSSPYFLHYHTTSLQTVASLSHTLYSLCKECVWAVNWRLMCLWLLLSYRKLVSAACILLAAKISSDLKKQEVKHLIDVSLSHTHT